MKVVDYFARDIHTFWATTFQFDLKLFDQFLLRRLGERPLNAVVLCDPDNLSAELSNLNEFDVRVAASANRRYLLRGLALPSGGRFHPKTYFLASRRRAVLLIGSGNLTRSGVDRGREVFVAYDATERKHAGVVQAWSRWIGELVLQAGDAQLRRRYERLRDVVPAVSSATGNEEFMSNSAAPLLRQIVSGATAPVAELHLTAPYFDREATAVAEVASALSPRRRLKLYLGARPSVDGPALRDTLESLGVPGEVYRFDPPKFVHAKLLGVVAEDGSGLLACGSANLSQAALTRTYSQPGSWGNCEALVLRRGSADEVRAAFIPPESTVVPLEPGELEALSFEQEPPATAWPVRLVSAELRQDRRIRVATAGDLPNGLAITWDQAGAPFPLDQEGASREQVAEGAEPLIVWLADGTGRPQSNRVVLDDPTALEAMLGERGGTAERPVELDDEDERSDLVALLAWTHRRFIFDVDETAAARQATNAQQEADPDETGFWERYVREGLSYDPRSHTYRPLTATSSPTPGDLLLEEIAAMLNAAPGERRLRVIRGSEGPPDPEGLGTGHPWSLSARQQLRARNLLTRWAHALADPRHAWLSPEAPARNYAALIDVLTLIWLGDALDEQRITDLLGEVWASFLGSGDRPGLFDRARPELWEATTASVPEDDRHLAAGLAYCALHSDAGWTSFVYMWQPFLIRGMECGVLEAGPLSTDLVEAIRGERPEPPDIDDLLQQRAEYVDSVTWGNRLAEELSLGRVEILSREEYKNVELAISVEGMPDPARDPRAVVVARRGLALKGVNSVLVLAGPERVLIRLGDVAHARIAGGVRRSTVPIDQTRLLEVERQHGSLAELLGLAAA